MRENSCGDKNGESNIHSVELQVQLRKGPYFGERVNPQVRTAQTFKHWHLNGHFCHSSCCKPSSHWHATVAEFGKQLAPRDIWARVGSQQQPVRILL